MNFKTCMLNNMGALSMKIFGKRSMFALVMCLVAEGTHGAVEAELQTEPAMKKKCQKPGGNWRENCTGEGGRCDEPENCIPTPEGGEQCALLNISCKRSKNSTRGNRCRWPINDPPQELRSVYGGVLYKDWTHKKSMVKKANRVMRRALPKG